MYLGLALTLTLMLSLSLSLILALAREQMSPRVYRNLDEIFAGDRGRGRHG